MPDNLPSKLVLVVEDSKNDALLLEREFHRAEVRNPIVWVPSGTEAIEYLAGQGQYADPGRFPKPSILILDLKMEGMDGFSVLRWVREQPELKNLLVVVLSGTDDVKSVGQAYGLGANSYLTKPLNGFDLANLVQFFRGYWLFANGASEKGSLTDSNCLQE